LLWDLSGADLLQKAAAVLVEACENLLHHNVRVSGVGSRGDRPDPSLQPRQLQCGRSVILEELKLRS
jgi:hypothetical protein